MKFIIPLLVAALLGSAACGKKQEADIATTGVAPTGNERQTEESPPANLKSKLQEAAGITLPADAVVDHYEKVSGSDLLIRSQLSLDKSSFANWLASLQLQMEDFADEKRYLLGPDAGWWDPSSRDILPTAQVMFDNGTVLNLAYQEIGENRLKVFLVFHGT